MLKMHVRKYLFPLILAILMTTVHQSQSKPMDPDDEFYLKQLNEMLIYVTKNLNRSKVLDFIMGTLYRVGDVPRKFVWENIEEILQYPAIANVKTDKMEQYKSKLNQIVQNYKTAPTNIVPLYDFRTNLRSIGLDVDDKTNSAEEELLVKKLREQIIDPMESRIKENYNKTMDALVKVVEQYINSLSAEELKREEKMENWLKQFKNENDTEKKKEMLDAFMKLF